MEKTNARRKMMTDNEIKQKAVELLHQAALGINLSKDEKKWFKQYNCVYGQWAKAQAEDIEIVRIDNSEQIVLFSFRADRYYQMQRRDGSVYGSVYKNDPWTLNNMDVGYQALGNVYNINIDKDIGSNEKIFYEGIISEAIGRTTNRVIFFNKNVEAYNYDFEKLKEAVGQKVDLLYRSKNETHLFNCPQKTHKIDISNFSIDTCVNFDVPVYGILLKIKDSKGKSLRMKLGYYFKKTERFHTMFNYVSQNLFIYDENWNSVEPRKSWFKWVL